ncbi:MAG TPA: aspartate kinase [Bacteroidetes bacterium]|nr:aspartate kinase [Bacteroidota bacterium]
MVAFKNPNFEKIYWMKVFKFGGASVKDADAIRNLGQIIAKSDLPLIVVVSAFGKTTNALEEVVNARYGGSGDPLSLLREIFESHKSVIHDLKLMDPDTQNFLEDSYEGIKSYLLDNDPSEYDMEYDRVVAAGELWSSRIIASWLRQEGHDCRWVDIRKVLITDKRFRDANILWAESEVKVKTVFGDRNPDIFLTQGFIGATEDGMNTTLGREGSDYSAAVLANMTDACEVQVWKDVPGVLNADPKWLDDAVVMEQLGYREAVEMAFSGARVIHPKTIKPLHNKGIPLIVRSFLDSDRGGTVIMGEAHEETGLPVFIRNQDQILISMLSRDFSFAIGDNISRILGLFYDYGIKANMVQASAVSLAVCADDDGRRIRKLISELEKDYSVIYNTGVEMLTIRRYTPEAINRVCGNREILVEQKTRRTVRFVVKPVQEDLFEV